MDLRTPSFPPPVESTPPPFSPSPWNAPSDRRDYSFAAGAVVAIVAIVAACIALVNGHEALGPSEWDPRVAPLVAFVEKTRGHAFVHPVYVEFLTPEQYRAHATDGPSDAEYDETLLRAVRALGLIGGDVDLSAELDEISDSGTLASYSPATRRIYVRGTELSPSLELTLVHELTHALQDQTFDLGFSRAQTDGEAFAMRALAEGDAIRVEDEYFDSLSETEQKQITDQAQIDFDSSAALNRDSATVMLSLFSAPYDLGVPFVRLLASIDELDLAFELPPTSEENIFDPISFLDGDQPQQVAAPELPVGARRNDVIGREVGAVMWYLLLAANTDQLQAMTAVDGWGGDAMTVYDQADALCVAMAFRGDTTRDADEMHDALEQVVRTHPTHTPRLTRDANELHLTLCDPGPSANPAKIDAGTIFAAPTARSFLLGIALEDPDVTIEQAGCAVSETLGALDDARVIELLQAESPDDPIVRTVLSDLAARTTACR